MSFSKRRTRVVRAQLRSNNPVTTQQVRSDRQRDRFFRLATLVVAVIATAAIINGPGPFFTFRLRQRPARELRVNVDQFKTRNLTRTEAERQAKASQVAPVLTNDPTPVRGLLDRVEDLLGEASKTTSVDALSEPFRKQWNVAPEALQAIHDASDTPEKLDDLTRRVRVAFLPLIDDGILGPDVLPGTEETSRTLAIHLHDQPQTSTHLVPRERVLADRIAQSLGNGLAEQTFVAAFKAPELGKTLFDLIRPSLASCRTLTFNEKQTNDLRDQARDSVADVFETHRRGELLAKQDQEISEDQLLLLKAEHEVAIATAPPSVKLQRMGASLVLASAIFLLLGYYISRNEPAIGRDLRKIGSLSILSILALGMARALAYQPWQAELVPIAIASMIVAIAYNPQFSLMITFSLSVLMTVMLNAEVGYFLVIMGGTSAGVLCLHEVRNRTKLLKVGIIIATTYFILTWATGLWQEQPLALIAVDSFWRAIWGLIAGFVLGGLLPFVESVFKIVTGISLLELGDITHPLLQELVRRAPGTYNHSIAVSTIAEAAAERIGANALLVRVGAYFHDIGKMLKPHYFVENQAGAVNRHSNLIPAMSTLIIIGHVKDGLDLGRQHHLPEPIIDLIEQHHGTTLVEYFFHEAVKRNQNSPNEQAALETLFRYPGPKPQSKEAGILMVSDAVESASRTLSEPTPGRIEGLVRDLLNKRLHDGQFDDCGLTLKEISEIRESLVKSLIGIYHGRVKYPSPKIA